MTLPASARLRHAPLLVAAAAATAATAAAAQPAYPYEGYLCCAMLSDGSWISDINYHGSDKQRLRPGMRLLVTGQGRWRVYVEIEGRKLAIGNDYSRTTPMAEFERRYVLAEDPSRRLAAYPPRIREAIAAGKVARGMTRDQVIMALGYPITSYTETLDAPLWRYWFDRSTEYQVFWGKHGRVEQVFGTPEVRAKVALD